MGLILDSSVVIAAERRGANPTQLVKQVAAYGDQSAVLSAVGLTELVHGIHRAPSLAARKSREAFLQELLIGLEVIPYTKATALLAGKIDGEQQSRGVTIPFADLLIGVTALEVGFSVLTFNPRHFRLVPGLSVVHF